MSKSVLITGCSENTIGNAIALAFAERGWQVWATARKTTTMKNLAEKGINLIALDISDGESVRAARDLISKETGGRLDVLFNNAGVRYPNMAIDPVKDDGPYLHPDDIATYETNVIATMAITRTFAPLVIAAKGTIAINASIASRTEIPGNAAYGASKAAVEMYTRILRLELRPLEVNVCLLMTGMVRSHMSAQRMTLPADSYYLPLEKKINETYARLEGDVEDANAFAQHVVERVARSNPPDEIWRGGGWWKVLLMEKLNIRAWFYPMLIASWTGFNKPMPAK